MHGLLPLFGSPSQFQFTDSILKAQITSLTCYWRKQIIGSLLINHPQLWLGLDSRYSALPVKESWMKQSRKATQDKSFAVSISTRSLPQLQSFWGSTSLKTPMVQAHISRWTGFITFWRIISNRVNVTLFCGATRILQSSFCVQYLALDLQHCWKSAFVADPS